MLKHLHDLLVSFGDGCEAFLSFIDTTLTATSAPDKPTQEKPDKKRPRTGEVELVIDDIDDIHSIDSEDERAGSPAKRPKTKTKAEAKRIVVEDIEDEPDPLPPVVVKIEKNLPVQPVLQQPTRTMQYVLEQANVYAFKRVSVAFMTTFNGVDNVLLRKNVKEPGCYAGTYNLVGANKLDRTTIDAEVIDTVTATLKEQIYVNLNINELVQSAHHITAFTSEHDASELVIVVPMVGICKDALALIEKKKPQKQRSQFEYFSYNDVWQNEKGVTSFLVKMTYEKIFQITKTYKAYANFDDFGTFV